jgi:hypothetical protein
MPPVHRSVFAAALLAALQGPAQALTIDTFSGNQAAAYDGSRPWATVLRVDGPSFLPGVTRTLQVAPQLGQPGLLEMAISSDVLYVSAINQDLAATLSYGLDQPMNLDLSSDFGLVLSHHVGGPYKLTVYAWTQAATPGDNPHGSAINLDAAPSYEGVLLVPFSAFFTNASSGQPVDWADVDSLSFVFSDATPGFADYMGLYSLGTVALPVPEPAGAASLLAGLALMGALLSRRRRAQGLQARTDQR